MKKDFMQTYLTLMDALLDQKSISQIVNIASKRLHCPMFVLDAGLRLVTKSKSEVDDHIWNDLTEKGYYSYESLKISKKEKRYITITQSDVPVLVNAPSMAGRELPEGTPPYKVLDLPKKSPVKHSRITMNIYDTRSNELGSVCILEGEKPFSSAHVVMINYISKIIALQLQQTGSVYRKTTPIESVILDVLYHIINTREALEDRLSFFQYSQKEWYFTIVVKSRDESDDIFRYREIIKNSFPLQHSAFVDQSILILINTDEPELPESENRRFREFLEENDLFAGLSFKFSDLLQLNRSHRQALAALDIGHRYTKDRLVKYEDIQLYEFAETLESSNIGPDAPHPVLEEIRAYDQKYKTEYENTLFTYLCNLTNIQNAASELGIHRNSLYYRIKKIEDLFHLDMSETNTIVRLYLSFFMK